MADNIRHLLSLSSSNSHIGRYSKSQISADNIGGPIYRSVSNMNSAVSRKYILVAS